MSEAIPYRRRNTDMVVIILEQTETKVRLYVISGPMYHDKFWVSQNFFRKNFIKYGNRGFEK